MTLPQYRGAVFDVGFFLSVAGDLERAWGFPLDSVLLKEMWKTSAVSQKCYSFGFKWFRHSNA